MNEDAARQQWLQAEMGISEPTNRKRLAPTEGDGEEEFALNMISRWEHLEESSQIPSCLMDKITIISSSKSEEAKETAKQVRAIRTDYVDDLRLWLQLMPPQRYRQWLDNNGYGDVSTETPICLINGIRIKNGCSALRASLPFWRGDKLTRDAGVADWLTVVHIPHPGVSATSTFIADKRSGKGYVIDPILDVDLYVKLALKESVVISAVFLTHTMIDTMCGHAALQRETCCSIYTACSDDRSSFDSIVIKGETKVTLSQEDCWIQGWNTPGFTSDSVTFAIIINKTPVALFPGCSILIDTVGRVDCEYHINQSENTSKELALKTAAESSFESLSLLVNKLTIEEVDTSNCVVFPSRVGMMFSAHTVEPKLCCRWRLLLESNYSMTLIPGHRRSAKDAGKAAFQSHILSLFDGQPVGIPFLPTFKRYHSDNIRGYVGVPHTPVCEIITLTEKMKSGWSWDSSKARTGLEHHLSPGRIVEEGCDVYPLFLDLRTQYNYSCGHIKGSLSIPMLEGIRFEAFSAVLIERHPGLKIICGVSSMDHVREGVMRLATVGLSEFVTSFVVFPPPDSKEYSLCKLERISTHQDASSLSPVELLDIRSSVENAAQAIRDVKHIPLEDLKRWITESPEHAQEAKHLVTYCAGGYRSFIATSILNAFDIRSTDVTGGGLTLMTHRPDIWALRDPQIKCTS
eukprot:TRINITY_DN1181_c1_g1_i1.p1 TRINITY_DN1181_c1_g1~~TRINITY_DN1181_c1_g1_i1.p1  ORF type:complete len:689 (+),score=116.96 TRINITY_DN1181_c1_g1_i1:35-2101(+)